MKTLSLGLFTVALCLSVGCGDEDDVGNATGGSAGASQGGKASAGSGGKASAGSGGKASGGAAPNGGALNAGAPNGGDAPGGTGGGGGVPNEGGVGGVPTPPAPMCQPPAPPVFGAGGAASAGGADGNGGASESAGAAGASSGSVGVAIQGSFSDSWDSHHVITNSTWTTGSSVFHISDVDNAARYLIAQNDQANPWNPCLWSRFDWTRSEGKLYYCQTAYNAASEAAALNTPPADPTNPVMSGCGGFPWTELVRE